MKHSPHWIMSPEESLLIFFSILFFYFLITIFLYKKGILERHNISFYGPALLLRTTKGRSFLRRIARKKRFWRAYGSFGVVFCFIVMILMVVLLVFNAWSISAVPPEQIPGPEFVLVIPGVNPILPLEYIWYIILSLAIAVVVHEFSHGILTFASKLKVKSLGILYLIIPLGAFVEPDEEQLKETSSSNRLRVYAAGPTSNFAVTLICFLLFSFVFMSAVQPAAEGVSIISVGEDTPADNIGLTRGTIITDINDTDITTAYDFFIVMENTTARQTVNITYVKDQVHHTRVTLADKYNYTHNESHRGMGYLGVGPNLYGVYLSILKNPFKNFPIGLFLFYILPIFGYFQGYNPIVAPFTDAYVISGPLTILGGNVFWPIVNALYWIFWLNLAVGLFNVLPMIPLDGGFLFNDAIGSFVKRLKTGVPEEQKTKIVKNISLLISLFILLLIIFPWLIKYL